MVKFYNYNFQEKKVAKKYNRISKKPRREFFSPQIEKFSRLPKGKKFF